MTERVAGWIVIAGSVVFFIGAAFGVPRVFMVRDRDERLNLLTEHRRAWVAAQPFYSGGPLVAAVGVAVLAGANEGTPRVLYAGSAVALLVGVAPWVWTTVVRARRVEEFAAGTLPGRPFTAYVLLTIAGLAVLAAGLLVDGWPGWLGWTTLGLDAVFLGVFALTRDIPPFVFYAVLAVVGGVLALG